MYNVQWILLRCPLIIHYTLYIIMTVDIITPDRKVFSGEATAVTFPGSEGQFQVLNNHAPLVSTLDSGPIIVQTTSGQQTFTVDGGVVEVLQNKVLVLAEAIVA
ncbi:hypothetical protein GCM10028773_05650 [Spirosoma koreense]